MSTLHIAYSTQGAHRATARMSHDDELILLGDGVYFSSDSPHRVLYEDAVARGLSSTDTISYDEMVELSIVHAKIVSWP